MTRIVAFSDTHNKHNEVLIPECDILIFAGDFSGTGRPYEVKSFLDWFSIQPAKHLVYIAGNHDLSFQRNPQYKAEVLAQYPKLHYLEDSSVELEGLKIYGSPFSPLFGNWAFMLSSGKALREHWAKIPDDTNILVTHGPCYGILDVVSFSGEHVGDRDLLNRVAQLNELSTVISGHIHENNGAMKIGDITLINASICDDKYDAVNESVIIDL